MHIFILKNIISSAIFSIENLAANSIILGSDSSEKRHTNYKISATDAIAKIGCCRL